MIKKSESNYSFIAAAVDVDKTDIQIIQLLLKGDNNKEIASKLKIPLSTIQRRTKRIIENDLVISTTTLNYIKFGYRIGLLHVYSSDGNIYEMAKKVLELDGITSVEIHIGNSDVLADYAYKDGKQLFNVISKIKKIQGIERAIWSERVDKLKDNEDNDLLLKSNLFS